MIARGLLLAALGGALGACTPPSPLARLRPSGQWATAYDDAQQAVIGGRYDAADSILAQYIDAHPGTPEASDALFWRALFSLDPGNRSASTATAIAELDRYLDGPPTLPHWREAATLRRVAAQLETSTRLAAAAAQTQTSASRVVTVDDHAKDDELNRLRTELAKANEELDRIKKRLVKP